MAVFEYVCEHVIPGCTTRIEGESRPELDPKILVHLRDHHDVGHLSRELQREVDAAVVRLHG